MPLPTWTAGRRARASELTAVNTQITTDGTNIDALGEAVTPVHGATSTAFTTTEVASSTLTATLVSGRKYYLWTSFSFGSSVAADIAQFRFRYRAGASIGTVNTATQAHISTVKAVAASIGYPVSFLAPLPSLSGQYTVALT